MYDVTSLPFSATPLRTCLVQTVSHHKITELYCVVCRDVSPQDLNLRYNEAVTMASWHAVVFCSLVYCKTEGGGELLSYVLTYQLPCRTGKCCVGKHSRGLIVVC